MRKVVKDKLFTYQRYANKYTKHFVYNIHFFILSALLDSILNSRNSMVNTFLFSQQPDKEPDT